MSEFLQSSHFIAFPFNAFHEPHNPLVLDSLAPPVASEQPADDLLSNLHFFGEFFERQVMVVFPPLYDVSRFPRERNCYRPRPQLFTHWSCLSPAWQVFFHIPCPFAYCSILTNHIQDTYLEPLLAETNSFHIADIQFFLLPFYCPFVFSVVIR